jgi:hypothetical protein
MPETCFGHNLRLGQKVYVSTRIRTKKLEKFIFRYTVIECKIIKIHYIMDIGPTGKTRQTICYYTDNENVGNFELRDILNKNHIFTDRNKCAKLCKLRNKEQGEQYLINLYHSQKRIKL